MFLYTRILVESTRRFTPEESMRSAENKGEAGLAIQRGTPSKGASWPVFVAIGTETREAGLASAQSSLLFVLFNAKETMTPLAVAHELKVTPGTVAGTLNPLEEMGLIERLRGRAADRRVVHLRMTAKGRKVMKQWMESCRDLIEERMSALTDAEKRRLIKLVAKIAPAGVPEGLASALKLEPFGRMGRSSDDR
jgi:DNA-binding MarR family transcriptional regulator